VYAQSGAAPAITALIPASAAVNLKFITQPNGDSALGIQGDHFLPGAVVLLDSSGNGSLRASMTCSATPGMVSEEVKPGSVLQRKAFP
jgi:hypothetical protein